MGAQGAQSFLQGPSAQEGCTLLISRGGPLQLRQAPLGPVGLVDRPAVAERLCWLRGFRQALSVIALELGWARRSPLSPPNRFFDFVGPERLTLVVGEVPAGKRSLARSPPPTGEWYQRSPKTTESGISEQHLQLPLKCD